MPKNIKKVALLSYATLLLYCALTMKTKTAYPQVTIEYGISSNWAESDFTPPDSGQRHRPSKVWVDAGTNVVAIEDKSGHGYFNVYQPHMVMQ